MSASAASATTTAAAWVVAAATGDGGISNRVGSGVGAADIGGAMGWTVEGTHDVRVRLVDLDSLVDAAAAAPAVSEAAVSEAELSQESSGPLAEVETARVGDGGQRRQYNVAA